MLFGKGVQEEIFEKLSFQRAVVGLATTLAAGIADSSNERNLPFALQTKISVEATVTFNGAATDGARIRIYEYFTTGSPATEPSNEGTIPVSAGDTVIQTFHFEIRSPYYTIEVMNLDGAQSLTSISVVVIEYNEPVAMQTPLDAHLMYHDATAWKRQGEIATEATLTEISANLGDETDVAAPGTGVANVIQLLKQAEIRLNVLDDWDESDRAKVNPIAGQAGIAANAGAMSALTTRITIATDDTHFGAVGAAADVDGVLHGQQRYIGEAVNDIKNAVEIMDDWDDGSDRANVNLNGDLANLDTGGTDNHEVVAIGLPGAGGHVVGGTATNPLRIDPTGTTTQPVSLVGASPVSASDSSAYETNRVAKASAGTLFSFTGFNSGPTQWIQVHDAAALPANSAVPEIILYVIANSNFAWDNKYGKAFATGIVLCNSTTGTTKTIGATNCWFNVEFS